MSVRCHCLFAKFLACGLAVVFSHSAPAAPLCATPGKDGVGTAITGIVNSYFPGTGTPAAGNTSLTVGARAGAAANIASGDLVMVIQMQDATINGSNDTDYGRTGGNGAGSTINNSGLYEFVKATSAVGAGGGTLTFVGAGANSGLVNSYATAAASATRGQRTYQVIRVPQYTGVSLAGGLTALAWNGSAGGVLAIDASGPLSWNGATVDVSGLGFRGGGGVLKTGGAGGANTDYRTVSTNAFNGAKAEGIAGTPIDMWSGTALVHGPAEGYPNGAYARGAPGNAGGGGTDGDPPANDENSGGGGGGNGGVGGQGGNSWRSNLAVGGLGGDAFANAGGRLAMGGGGGSGTLNNGDDNAGNTGLLSNGGLGGALVHFRFNTTAGTGTLRSDGTAGANIGRDGAAGGGAGGTIFAAGCAGLSGLTAQARGGAGGNVHWALSDGNDPPGYSRDDHGPGGGGAGGAVLTSAAATTAVTGGAHGGSGKPESGIANVAYGSTSGAAGTVSATITAASPSGVAAGCTCSPTAAVVVSLRAVEEPGGVVVHWETRGEDGTAGFDLYRLSSESGQFERVNDSLLVAPPGEVQGGAYSLVDPQAQPGAAHTYRLIEREAGGVERVFGPWQVEIERPVAAPDAARAGREYGASPRERDAALLERLAAAERDFAAESGFAMFATRESGELRGAALDSPQAKDLPRLRLAVDGDGIYFVSSLHAGQQLGLTESQVASLISAGSLRLTSRGQEVAWLPVAGGFYFYAQAIDSIYTRTNVYMAQFGQKGKQIVSSAPPPARPATASQSFLERLHAEQENFAATAVARDPASDYWFWDFVIAGDPTYGTRTFTIDVPDLAGASPGALQVSLFGATDTPAAQDHHAHMRLNGADVGDVRFDGIGSFSSSFSLPPGLLRAGANSVEVSGILDSGAPYSIFYVDSFDLTYPRLYRARSDRLELTASSDAVATIAGFSSGKITVFDVSNARFPTRVESITDQADGFRASFTQRAGGRYFAAGASSIVEPGLGITRATKLQVQDTDYLIVAPRSLVSAAGDLAKYRRSSGFSPLVVSLEDVYDELGEGIASPEALKSFLAQFSYSAQGEVRYVVLVGKGTFDYKDYLKVGGNLMPPLLGSTPFGLYAEDSLFAPLANGAPTLSIGRLPVVGAAELTGYVAKLQAYEHGAHQPWMSRIVLSADSAGASGNFPSDSEALVPLLPAGLAVDRVYLTGDPAQIGAERSALLNDLAKGALLWNYVGHGALDRLSAESLFTNADAPALNNAGRLPALVAMTCSVGRFEVPGFVSLAETLVVGQDKGAIVAWVPAGLSVDAEAATLNRALFEQLFGARNSPVSFGQAVVAVLRKYGQSAAPEPFMRTLYNVIGDPAVHLRTGARSNVVQ
ncbi:MAG TPA: C25 family cysteine peptidase [Thermoanaerobaculia bacterium]|nr:C25 family cysteine peptidase [Thermoanaerobaculia bacterium]